MLSFALFKRSNPMLPVAVPRTSTPRSSVVRGVAAAWNALLSLLVFFTASLCSFFSFIAGSLERLATTLDGFRVVLSSNNARPTTEDVTPEPFNSVSAPITPPPPALCPANSSTSASDHDRQTTGQLTPPRRRSRRSIHLPTHVPQPASGMDSSLQLAVAYQIISNLVLNPEQSPKYSLATILVDKVPIGLGLLPPELAPVFKTPKHICDIISDQDRYAHLVYGEADPARPVMESPAPRIEVFLPGPINLDSAPNASQLELKPLDQETTHVESGQVVSNPSDFINDILELNITAQEEGSSIDLAVLILPPPGNDTSMDTSSDDSVLSTPIDHKFPAHVAKPEIVAAAEAPHPGFLPQDHTAGTLDRILQLPSSVTLLADSWDPPSPFFYHDQSPTQGTTRPIACRKPAGQAAPQQSPASPSLRHMGSSVSLFADAWNPPSQFVYEYQPPPMDGTRPIVPRNRRHDFQTCPGDLVATPGTPTKDTVSVVANQLPTTSTTRSMRRRAMIFEPEKPLEQLVSTLRSSAPAPSIGGPPGL